MWREHKQARFKVLKFRITLRGLGLKRIYIIEKLLYISSMTSKKTETFTVQF